MDVIISLLPYIIITVVFIVYIILIIHFIKLMRRLQQNALRMQEKNRKEFIFQTIQDSIIEPISQTFVDESEEVMRSLPFNKARKAYRELLKKI